MTISPFTYVDCISKTKKNIMVDAEAEKQYAPWIINKALAYYVDTVLYANDMNLNYHLSHKLQFEYYINSIRPRSRYEKWAKTEKNGDLAVVKDYYNYSDRKARAALSLLNETQINEIKKKNAKGGLSNGDRKTN